MLNDKQLQKIKTQDGFIAALDQSGGSTPKALRLYGIKDSDYSGDEEMFSVVHTLRTRIITSPSFNGERILGAILFENTLDREIENQPSAHYLWEVKQVIPFLKIDKGLADEADGVQMMKPIPELNTLLRRAKGKGIFGTKMRSVIKLGHAEGIKAVVRQQFEIGRQIISAGLMPIIEPEVDINSPEKKEAEIILKEELLTELHRLGREEQVMFKLTLPEEDNFYAECMKHANVLKVVALSGGYSREEANARMSRNHGVVASFSRALTEGLTVQHSDAEFNAVLNQSIESIFQASKT